MTEGSPNVVDLIRDGAIDLVINTPGRPRRPHRRLRDPRGRDPPPDPLHHDPGRRLRRRAGDRPGPVGRRRWRCRTCTRGASESHAAGRRSAAGRAGRGGRRLHAAACCATTAARWACPASSSCSRPTRSRPAPTCRGRCRRPGPDDGRDRLPAGRARRRHRARWPRPRGCRCWGRSGHGFEPRDGPPSWSAAASARRSCPGWLRDLPGRGARPLLGFREPRRMPCAPR